jgi:hypothetical protein
LLTSAFIAGMTILTLIASRLPVQPWAISGQDMVAHCLTGAPESDNRMTDHIDRGLEGLKQRSVSHFCAAMQ